MKVTPVLRLYGLGIVIFVALAICSRKFHNVGEPFFLIWMTVAGIAYLLSLREFSKTSQFPKRAIVFGLVLSAAWHVLFLIKPPGVDDDIHRYVWDGRMQRLGYNPYVVVPNDPALAALHTAETRSLNNPYLPSPYPPGAQLFFRAVTAIHESAFALKTAFVLCDLAIVLVLLDVLRSTRQPAHWVLAFAWHPLLATEVAGSGHVDIAGTLLLVVSVAALWRRWRAVAAVAFALAVAIKFLPIVLAPLYWRRLRIRDAFLAAFALALLYVPFLEKGRISFGSLGSYVHSFRFNDPVFAMFERVLAPEIVAGVVVLAGFVTAIWLRRKSEPWSSERWSSGAYAWPMAASLLCAPVIYPWYLLWLLPFLRSRATLPIAVWTVGIIPTYYVWHLRTLGRLWLVPGWVMLVEYGAVALAVAMIGLRDLTRTEMPAANQQASTAGE